MPYRFAAALLCVAALSLSMAGCAPTMTHKEGPMATDYRALSKEDLDRYAARGDEEIARIKKGPPPAGKWTRPAATMSGRRSPAGRSCGTTSAVSGWSSSVPCPEPVPEPPGP